MTTITCETATLVDAVSRAARVAPSKGQAFDKAAGILFEVRPDKPSPLYVKATDLDSTYLQRVAVKSAEGDDATWRLPSTLLAGIMATLPVGSGQSVTLTSDGNEVSISTGNTSAVLRSIDPTMFPDIKPFDPTGMIAVDELPRRVGQVAWACDRGGHGALTGVHIDGTALLGCDSYLLAQVPCKVAVDAPITVPMAAVAPLLRNTGSVMMRATPDRLHLMPDDDTQITCTILADSYPNVSGIKRDTFSCEFVAQREALLAIVQRMLVLGKAERYTQLKISSTKDKLALSMQIPEVGQVDDELGVTGGPTDDSESFDFIIDPTKLNQIGSTSTAGSLTFKGGPSPARPIYVADSTGYEVWCMPISTREQVQAA